MKSAISLWNRTLFSHFTSSVFWLSVLFLIGNILVQPLALWIISINSRNTGQRFLPDNPLDQMAGFQLAGGMIYIVFLAVFLFSYKNKADSLDFMHALPIGRRRLLSHALIAGFIHIIVPLAITAVILFFERYFLAFDMTLMNIIEWLLHSLFVLFVIFAFSVFAGFLVNSGFVHMQLVIIIFFLPLIFWGLVVTVADTFFDGVNTGPATGDSGLMSVVIDNTFPILAVQQVIDGIVVWKTILWAILALVFIGLSYMLYQRARNENVHFTFNHLWFRNVLVALLSISGMLVIGLIISLALPGNVFIFILSFLIGAIFSYIVVEMSFQGTVRIQRHKGALITTGVSLVIFWVIFTAGWQQYVSYIPEVSEVESVSLNSSWNGNYSNYGDADRYMSEDYLYIGDTEVIEGGVRLHQEMVETPSVKSSMNSADWVDISYRMDDGSTVSRRYDSVDSSSAAYRDILAEVNSGEYARNYDMLYNVETPSEVRLVEITRSGGYIPVEAGETFVEEYKRAAHQIEEEIPVYIGSGSFSLVSANVEFDSGFRSGNASIYNPVLQEAVRAEQSLTSFLGLELSERVFVTALDAEEKEAFFRDFRTLEPESLITKYDLEEATGEEKRNVLDEINQGGLDASGDRVLLYHSEAKGWMGPADGMTTALEEYELLGIE